MKTQYNIVRVICFKTNRGRVTSCLYFLETIGNKKLLNLSNIFSHNDFNYIFKTKLHMFLLYIFLCPLLVTCLNSFLHQLTYIKFSVYATSSWEIKTICIIPLIKNICFSSDFCSDSSDKMVNEGQH